MGREIRLTDATIERMVRDRNVAQAFEFLRQPPMTVHVRKRCGGCGKRRKSTVDTVTERRILNHNAIRNQIIGLGATELARLKQLLKVAAIRVRVGRGKSVQNLVL
jgi:hypothetical protein